MVAYGHLNQWIRPQMALGDCPGFVGMAQPMTVTGNLEFMGKRVCGIRVATAAARFRCLNGTWQEMR